MSFKDQKYEIVRNVISHELADFLDMEFELIRNTVFLSRGLDPQEDKFRFGDGQVALSFAHYAPFCFETLSCGLIHIISDITNKNLYPTYSYARAYYKDAVMEIHKDRPSCQYSATINISNDPDPWDIWFRTEEGKDIAISLCPGDMIVYKGTDLEHWRNANPNEKVVQAFLHYVDADGEYASFKFDKRPYLGFPANTRMG